MVTVFKELATIWKLGFSEKKTLTLKTKICTNQFTYDVLNEFTSRISDTLVFGTWIEYVNHQKIQVGSGFFTTLR